MSSNLTAPPDDPSSGPRGSSRPGSSTAGDTGPRRKRRRKPRRKFRSWLAEDLLERVTSPKLNVVQVLIAIALAYLLYRFIQRLGI